MSGIALSRNGESLPILSLNTRVYQQIDGTAGHAESTILEPGIYRVVVAESAGNNAYVDIHPTSASATTEQGAFMPLGVVEYIFIEANGVISVVDGILNIVKAY